jgi:hypothetical protein
LTMSAPTSTPQPLLFSCSTAALYKASPKLRLGTLTKECLCPVGYPRDVREWDHRRPEDADPTLGTLEVDTGVKNWCPLDACSAVIWPHPTGRLSA